MESPEVIIRTGTRQDVAAALDLVRELAVYERAPDEVEVTVDRMEEWGFGSHPLFGMEVAERAGSIVGIAIWYVRYSTWKGPVLYLEDIVVRESERGRGIGHQLFRRMLAIADEKGYHGMAWQVLDWNEPALNFYRKYGASMSDEWLNGRLTREQVRALIAS